jgi:hypothetical protein
VWMMPSTVNASAEKELVLARSSFHLNRRRT